MSRSLWLATVVLVLPFTAGSAAAQKQVEVSTQQAASVKGKLATVCGPVASVRLAMRTGGAPTFINFDKPNPDQTFTAGKRVCATGTVTDWRGVPEIVVHGPDEIRVAEKSGK